MSKILVEVHIPAASEARDIFIPYECRLWEIRELVKAVISEEISHSFIPSDDTILCDASTGEVFDVDQTPEEIGLENGSRLMLM